MLPSYTHPADLFAIIRQFRIEGKKIALVPTMGNLHEGHLSLIQKAEENADVIVVSIFVNPIQFGPTEDYQKYPRTFVQDMEKIEHSIKKPVILFHPTPEDMYAENRSTWVTEESLTKPLCGASRPTHFRGVTTVVAKLFNIVQPDIAVFGQKDAQQALIIQRMVRDLSYPIQIIIAPIVRNCDGLALSSRNQYLSNEQKQSALVLSRSLFKLADQVRAGKCPTVMQALADIRDQITHAGGAIDYVEAREIHTLEPAKDFKSQVLVAVAVYFGETRLIDNVIIGGTPCL